MIIKNVTVLNFSDLSIHKNVDLLIEGDRIKKIIKKKSIEPDGSGEERQKDSNLKYEGRDDEVIEGADFYVIPGLTNCHSHTGMILLRGCAEDVNSLNWFNKYIWVYEKNLLPEDVYIGTLLGAAEMLLSGVTLVCDHYFYMDKAFKAYQEAGMKADLAWAVFGRGDDQEENFKEAMNFTEKFSGVDKRISISLGPHSPYICPENFLKKVGDISHKTGLKIHIHVSEEKWQVDKSLKEKGKTPVQYLAGIGLIKENSILAHAYWATDRDLEIIKNAGAGVAHAPKTYMRFGFLKDFLPRALKSGIKIALASDGVVSNSSMSIFEAARDAALLAKLSVGDAEKGRIEEIIPLLSSGGKIMGNEKIGEIKEGYIADLVLIKKDSPNMNPAINIFANILYSLSQSDIDTVIVDGKVVVREGKLLTIDVKEVVKEANRIKERLLQRTDEKPMQEFGR
ncbi:MAG: amidohydrolase [Candidatus Infernicultor aquiphilus]|uniref:Amidohydrolase n=1 Tax=Candidatus Infernicultor aquiphilus TaxID=1805029 RepID=A0A2M7K7V5_9BACT|nr:MAG: amidohydrolase [Candidatus Atribacteria bacterium CG_4_8_14_3_um_filter_34_18]